MKVQQGYEKEVKLSTSEGYECVVEATNVEDETKHFTVIAYTEDGLECATELTVAPIMCRLLRLRKLQR